MADIRINPAEVDGVGGQFTTKAGELDGLIQQANSMMNNLRPTFTGNRANKAFGEWEGMQTNLRNAVEVLNQASRTLKEAASAFAAVDGS